MVTLTNFKGEIEEEPFDRETIEEESEMIIYGPSDTSNTHLSKGVIKIRFVFSRWLFFIKYFGAH